MVVLELHLIYLEQLQHTQAVAAAQIIMAGQMALAAWVARAGADPGGASAGAAAGELHGPRRRRLVRLPERPRRADRPVGRRAGLRRRRRTIGGSVSLHPSGPGRHHLVRWQSRTQPLPAWDVPHVAGAFEPAAAADHRHRRRPGWAPVASDGRGWARAPVGTRDRTCARRPIAQAELQGLRQGRRIRGHLTLVR